MKTKNTTSFQGNLKSKDKSKAPTCPHCGNQEMNYYDSSKGVWKCSKAHLHGDFNYIVSPLKSAV